MKRFNVLWVMAICVFLGVSASVYAEITGSAHDFSGFEWSHGEICKACHTPHFANPEVSPLWNHEVTVAEFTLYDSPTFDGPQAQPGMVSVLCLSCHDGTVALDSFGGNSGSVMITDPGLIGTDLSDDHPVGFNWLHQTVEDDSPSVFCNQCHVEIPMEPRDMPLPFYAGDTGATLECATCHEPHNRVPDDSWAFLRKSNTGSALCLHCHDK